MRWLLEADMSRRTEGAVRFAGWLRRAPDESVVAIHVVDDPDKWALDDKDPPMGVLLERAAAACRSSIEILAGPGTVDDVIALHTDDPSEVLARATANLEADILVVGRRAETEGWSLVHLGKVSRRLLRQLPSAVLVVPPDLDPHHLGPGPIVVAVGPDAHSAAAVRFARKLAAPLQTNVRMVHVRPAAAPVGMPVVDPALGYAVQSAASEPIERRNDQMMHEWRDEHGFGDLPLQIEMGSIGARVLDVAKSVQATMLVCGSRQLTLAERFLMPSVASELAGHAGCPTLVVPLEGVTLADEVSEDAPTMRRPFPNKRTPTERAAIARAEGEGMVHESAKVSAEDVTPSRP